MKSSALRVTEANIVATKLDLRKFPISFFFVFLIEKYFKLLDYFVGVAKL